MHATDNSKHSFVKVGFFVKMRREDLPALRITANSLSKQKYSNFELIVVSDEMFDLEGVAATLHVGSMDYAMTSSDCHVCCAVRVGQMIHPGVCFTVVQDYRMSSDNSARCTDIEFVYDRKLPLPSAPRLIPWVYEGS
jgi:cellulose synthase/poly-beta-1,6-N-acetylglucosamine synthase-like glycosyltransferase